MDPKVELVFKQYKALMQLHEKRLIVSKAIQNYESGGPGYIDVDDAYDELNLLEHQMQGLYEMIQETENSIKEN